MKNSAFYDWFVAQHGNRPAGDPDDIIKLRIEKGREAELLLQARKDWDARWQSALYAWQVRSAQTQEVNGQ